MPANPEQRTLARLWEVYQASDDFLSKKDRTRQGYIGHANKLLAWGGASPVRVITRKRVKFYYSQLLAAKGVSTASARIRVLSLLISHAVDLEWLAFNSLTAAATGAKLKLKTPPGRIVIYSTKEIGHLIKTADKIGRPDIGDAIAFDYVVGLRPGDICRFCRDQFKQGEVRIHTAKTDTYLAVALPNGLRARLAAGFDRQQALHGDVVARFAAAKLRHPPRWRDYEGATLIINDKTGLPFLSATLPHDFANVRNEAAKLLPALAEKRFQDLRDTAITRFAEAGATIGHICAITGHKEKRASAILERHYLARTSDMAKTAMNSRTALEAGEKHGLF